MSGSNSALVRNLLREIQHVNLYRNKEKSLLEEYVLSQSRKYQVTDEQFCKAQEEMKFLAKTYLCYLKSQRTVEEIHKKYQGKGERDIRETAEIVGFKLPHDEQ